MISPDHVLYYKLTFKSWISTSEKIIILQVAHIGEGGGGDLGNAWKNAFFSSENRPLLGMGGHSSHPPFAHNNRVPSSHPRIPGIFHETFVTGRLIISLEVELGILAHMWPDTRASQYLYTEVEFGALAHLSPTKPYY